MNTSAQMANGDTSKLTSDDICLRQADATMLVGLNRGAKRNALNAVMIGKIQNYFRISRRRRAPAVILYGEGEHFCCGLDLSAISGDPGEG